MLKTLCVAVFVLSLTSVCRPASLACDKLLKPLDKGPDLSGSWYLIAVASDNCWAATVVNAILLLSIKADISSRDIPNIYDVNFNLKIYGLCTTESEPFFYENNTMFDIDENNKPTDKPDVILHSGCPDCIVVKGDDFVSTLMLFSRRKTVTAAELKEFESQTECLSWSKPQVLNSDHDYQNCVTIDDDGDTDVDNSELARKILTRLKTTYTEPLKCFVHTLLHFTQAAYDWVGQVLL